MRSVAVIALALFSISFAHSAASPQKYEVEVLVFEQNLPDLEKDELWTHTNTAPDTVEALRLGNTPVVSELTGIANTLTRNGRYRILLHNRWVQSTDDRSITRPVALVNNSSELNGSVKLYVSRFLHVELNLGFHTTNNPELIYRINEQRRIKSYELHYFDHPKFGALVRIAPSVQ